MAVVRVTTEFLHKLVEHAGNNHVRAGLHQDVDALEEIAEKAAPVAQPEAAKPEYVSVAE